ncbi:hypothetical protein [Sulfitobacter sp. S190]|uniref:hypothetical protein n=1 Tax=Sulfitobacter sp. S190 TaxID=2867022 RepID=UPI0021A7E40F|nr:hypothetical protein [Sulfitobacter sp. S190]UWR23577.1 hypothetical protein K3756_06275 [Sulfitobacter sp. S190]
MKPNFALSLSFDGITLLHRAAGGWREVGAVSVSSGDLAGELAVLRKTASALEPAGVRSKLILPASQIKYLSIDTPGLSDSARKREAEKALEASTPYAIADLAYDISEDGPRTHVAGVARETLAEAEAFATEHRFHPVSFVGNPEDADYLGEPFFGKTSEAETLLDPGEDVDPDGIAVVVVGAAEAPAPAPEENPVAPPPDAPQMPDDTPDATAAEEPPLAPDDTDTSEPSETSETAKGDPAPPPPMTPADDTAENSENSDDTPSADDTPPSEETQTAPVIAAAQPVADTPEPAAPPRKPELKGATRVGNAPAPGFASRRAPAAPPRELQGAARAKAAAAAPVVPATALPDPDSSSLRPDPVADAPAKGGFLSRRKPRPAADPVPVAATPAGDGTEAERMTIFGARTDQVGGKPRFLGLIMTVILLVFLAGVAAWASVFMDDGLAGIFRDREPRATASAPEYQVDPEVIRAPSGSQAPEDPLPEATQTAALDPVLSAEDGAVLDALSKPQPKPERPIITPQEAAARYAVTGIWPLAPEDLPQAPQVDTEQVYLTSIDSPTAARDALALPGVSGFETDVQLAAIASPPAPGVPVDVLITPTAEGVLAPGGFTLVAGSPPQKPPASIARFAVPLSPAAAEAEAQAQADAARTLAEIAGLRPRARPIDLAETTQRAQLGGATLSELQQTRPRLRSAAAVQSYEQAQAAKAQAALAEAAAEAAARKADEQAAEAAAIASAAAAASLALPTVQVPNLEGATRLATASSRRPDTRPRNFARIVKRAQRAAPKETRVAAAASVAPRTVTPKIPSKTSVAKSATVKNAINLRKVNLIGVYGKPSSRRALIRLSNGRYKKVSVGDRIDGGRVQAIGNAELRYSKGGRNVVLRMPKG